jgi:hypothetical protein
LLKKKKQLDAAKAEKAKQQGLWSTLTNSLFGSSATTEDKGTAAHGDSDNAAIAASTVSDEGEQSGGGDEQALEAGTAEDGQSMVEEDNRIHVFSLATGHMYERLVSVVRSVGFSPDEMALCRVHLMSHDHPYFLSGRCSCAS